jgi:hypothetical protein
MPNIGNSNSTGGRVCLNCGGPMHGKPPHAKYCSKRCQTRAYRRRRYHADIEKGRAENRASYARRKARRVAEAAETAPNLWARLRTIFFRLIGRGAK